MVELANDERKNLAGKTCAKRQLKKICRKRCSKTAPSAQALFEYELQEHVEEYIQSKREDGDNYFLAVTEHTNDVAMLLIDKNDKVLVNEKARNRLKKLWRDDAYRKNLQRLIPDMARELDNGYLYVVGVKVK